LKIIFDLLGGDNSPFAGIEGCVKSLDRYPDTEFILVGDEAQTETALEQYTFDRNRITTIHAPEAITGNDKPTEAVRTKKDSSMMTAIRMLKDDGDISALVSTGATGSLMAGTMLRIKRIKGIRRPAFCPVLPTMSGGVVGVCDSGANVDILPSQFVQFAILGSNYIRAAYGIDDPKVALLNIGTEEEKGDELHKKGYELLSNTPGINFVGNMEARDLLTGKYDLVVADGFSGNIMIKSAEGTALELLKKIKRDINKKVKYKMGAALMYKMFMEEKEFMNYQNYGGSVLLGTEKIIVKGHGSADVNCVMKCIELAHSMYIHNMNDKVNEALETAKETIKESEEKEDV